MRDEYGNEKYAASVTTQRQATTHTVPAEAPLEAGKILALAGGAAGALAGLWVILSEREEKETPKTTLEQARALIDEAAQRARAETSRAEASLVSTLAGAKKDAKKQSRRSQKAARKSSGLLSKKAQSDTSQTIDKVAQFLKEAREDAAKMASHEATELSGLAKSLRADTGKRLEETKKASREYQKQAKKNAEKAKGEAASIADLMKTKVIDAEHAAEGLVAAAVIPKVTSLAAEASSALSTGKSKTEELRKKAESDVIPEAKKRAEEMRRKAESEVLPEAKKRAEELRKKAESDLLPEAKKRAEVLTHTLEEQAKTAKQTLGATSAEAATKLTAAASTVEHEAAEASEAVKRAGRETRSLLLWLALAGVLIFTVFLDEEQQKRLKELAYELFGEAKDMYADMKGEDTFQS